MQRVTGGTDLRRPLSTPEPVLTAEKLQLRPLKESDAGLLLKWFFHSEAAQWLQLSEDPPEQRTPEAVRERYRRMRASSDIRLWRIDVEGMGPVGVVELVGLHPLHKRAEMHVCVGEPEAMGRGYGRGAIRRVLEYGFDELDLRRIHLVVDADNRRAIRCFGHCGFREEGLLRQHRLRYGQPTDMVAMAALRDEFPRTRGRSA